MRMLSHNMMLSQQSLCMLTFTRCGLPVTLYLPSHLLLLLSCSLNACRTQQLILSISFMIIVVNDLPHHCRYLAQDSQFSSSAAEQAAWDVPVEFYRKARRLSPQSGKVHNQLAVVEESRKPSAAGVSLAACMRFALATCAEVTMDACESNWRRCIGSHREAFQASLSEHRLAGLRVDDMCVSYQAVLCQV